jgi:hypothetical protein
VTICGDRVRRSVLLLPREEHDALGLDGAALGHPYLIQRRRRASSVHAFMAISSDDASVILSSTLNVEPYKRVPHNFNYTFCPTRLTRAFLHAPPLSHTPC